MAAKDIRPLRGCYMWDFSAGADMEPGDVVYVHTDGTVLLADNSDTKAKASAVGVVVAGYTTTPSGSVAQTIDIKSGMRTTVVLYGMVSGYESVSEASLYFVDSTAGDMTTTAPTTSGDFVKVIGYGINDTTILIAPVIEDLTAIT